MKLLVPFACLLLTGFGCADPLLRLSDVFPIPGDNFESHTIDYGNGVTSEELHVSKTVLLSEADVLDISPLEAPDAEELRALDIRLNGEGAAKFARITEQLKGGRIAVFVNGEIKQAPVVRVPIFNGRMQISGLTEAQARHVHDTFHAKSGKPPWPKDKPFWRNTPPAIMEKQETIPYTEEEYREIKKNRMGMGIHYLDSLPGREELGKTLAAGLTYEDVVRRYGKPTCQEGKPQEPDTSATWIIAPERAEPNPFSDEVPVGFHVDFSHGKVSGWRQNLMAMSRRDKIVGAEPSKLKVVLPEIEITAGEVDWVSYVEGIQIPGPAQVLNKTDLAALLGMVRDLSPGSDNKITVATRIAADCDFMKTLAHNLPEVADLRKKARDGRVHVHQLIYSVDPYLCGEKPLVSKVPNSRE